MPTYDIAPQFVKAEIRRQKYLDFLNDHPNSSAADIERHMLETFNEEIRASNTLKQLVYLKEVVVERISYKNQRYTATTTTTTPAEVFSNRQKTAVKRRNDRMREEAKPSGVNEPWKFVNRPDHPDHVKPTNPDAQGSGRGRVFVGGTWGMV